MSKKLTLTGRFLVVRSICVLMVFLVGEHSYCGDFSAQVKGLASQCQILLVNFVSDLFPLSGDQDILELNRLMSSYRYRANSYTFVGPHMVSGFINRQFIKENIYRVSGRPIPTNHLVYPVIRRNREQGLKEIIAAMANVQEEHSWAYVPSRQFWVDTTLAVEERVVYQDAGLLEGLHEKYGSIEIYHTHPESLTSAINVERNFPFGHLISGALPTVGDLSTLIAYAWNWRRDIPFSSGVIHPLGVTYYLPTHDLLKSSVGPGMIDIGTIGPQSKDVSRLNSVLAIKQLVQRQENVNRINKFSDEQDPKGFRLRFFSIEEFFKIGDWLFSNLATLSTDEANNYLHRRAR